MLSLRTIQTPKLEHPLRRPISARFRSHPANRIKPRGFFVPAVSLILFSVTATLIGMRYMDDFGRSQFPLNSAIDLFPYRWGWSNPHLVPAGLPFAFTLLAIFFAHALGRYGACRLFGIDTSLPVVLSSLNLKLTYDDNVRARHEVPSRAALIVTAGAGPIAGFTIALATTCYGLIHSTAMGPGTAPALLQLAAPGMMEVLRGTLIASYPDIPPLAEMVPHPVLVASWIGLLLTAMNLLPAGRSDGGSIVYAISPRLHRATSGLVIAALLYFGTVEWVGWLVPAWLLLLPPMMQSTSAEPGPLGVEWLVLAPVCFVILLLSASTQPILGMSLVQVMLRMH